MKTKKNHSYPLVYTGLMLFGKRGKRCREICRHQGKVLLEFEDRRRDWCYSKDIELSSTLSKYAQSLLGRA